MAARKDDAGGRTLRSLTRLSSTDYEGDSQNVGPPITGFTAKSSSKTRTPRQPGRKLKSTALSLAIRFKHDEALSISGPEFRYTPATIRGAWEKTTGHAVCGMGGAKDLAGLGGPLSLSAAPKLSSIRLITMSCFAAVRVSAFSCQLHNFSGTLNVIDGRAGIRIPMLTWLITFMPSLPRATQTICAARCWPIMRILNTNEWGTTALGKALSAAATLTAVSALAGDRVVIEIGYRARNTTASTRTGTIWYGGSGSDLASGGAAAGGVGLL
jgi:hypothetical protein